MLYEFFKHTPKPACLLHIRPTLLPIYSVRTHYCGGGAPSYAGGKCSLTCASSCANLSSNSRSRRLVDAEAEDGGTVDAGGEFELAATEADTDAASVGAPTEADTGTLDRSVVDLGAAVGAAGREGTGFSHATSSIFSLVALVDMGLVAEGGACSMNGSTSVGCLPFLLPFAGTAPPPAPGTVAVDGERRRRRLTKTTARTSNARNASPPTTPPTMGPVLDFDFDLEDSGGEAVEDGEAELDVWLRSTVITA